MYSRKVVRIATVRSAAYYYYCTAVRRRLRPMVRDKGRNQYTRWFE